MTLLEFGTRFNSEKTKPTELPSFSFSHFHTISKCDGQADAQFAIALSVLSIASCGIKTRRRNKNKLATSLQCYFSCDYIVIFIVMPCSIFSSFQFTCLHAHKQMSFNTTVLHEQFQEHTPV